MSSKGLTMADDKIHAILDWPEPRKVKDVQSFLGFANFYQRFIHNYSEITVPLTRLTRKGLTWDFNEGCHTAFRTLKEAFTSVPVLAHWKPDQQMVMETDTSDYALVAILLAYDAEGPYIPSLSTPKPLLAQSSTTMYMTKNYRQFSKHPNGGDITWKARQNQ